MIFSIFQKGLKKNKRCKGRKRRFFARVVLIWYLFRGLPAPEITFVKSQNTQLSVNLNQLKSVEGDLESLESTVDNSSVKLDNKVIQTGTGVITLVRRKVENIDDLVLNESLSETNALKNDSREIILVKDSGSGFADAFTPPLPIAPGRLGRGGVKASATGTGGSNPGSGGGSSNPGSGGGDSCPANPTLKSTPEVVHDALTQGPKTKKQKAKEKMKKELQESIEEEEKLNDSRKGKIPITLIIKDGVRFFAPHDQLRKKFYHAPDLDSPIPGTVDVQYALSLPYKERLAYLGNESILPEVYVEQYGRDLRFHILSPDTKVIPGTLGANREANGGPLNCITIRPEWMLSLIRMAVNFER